MIGRGLRNSRNSASGIKGFSGLETKLETNVGMKGEGEMASASDAGSSTGCTYPNRPSVSRDSNT